MKTIKFGTDKEIKVPTSWEDITLRKYIDIAKLEEAKSTYPFEELYLMRMIEIICGSNQGDLDDLTIEELNTISTDINFLTKNQDWKIFSNLEIDGQTYVFPADLNKITMGEYISIKTLQEKMKDQTEAIPYILSIILRPGKKVIDEHTGKERWIQNKFDVEGIEHRRELFLQQPVYKLLGAIDFFLGGKKIFTNNTSDSTAKEQKYQVSE